MHAVLGAELRDCQLTPDRLECYFRFEFSAVTISFRLGHLYSSFPKDEPSLINCPIRGDPLLERTDVLKDIPTTTEAGLPAFQAMTWTAIFAPKDLPQAIQSKLTNALAKALDDLATRKRLIELGAQIPDNAHRTPQALQMLVETEVTRWAAVLKAQEAPAK